MGDGPVLGGGEVPPPLFEDGGMLEVGGLPVVGLSEGGVSSCVDEEVPPFVVGVGVTVTVALGVGEGDTVAVTVATAECRRFPGVMQAPTSSAHPQV